MSSLNLNLNMNEVVLEGMKKCVVDYCCNVIGELGSMYNFDSEEAISRLNLYNIDVKLIGEKKEKVVKEKVIKEKVIKEKSKVPLPFNNKKNENCCNGLRQNHGLYTQCESVKVKDSEYCKKCQSESVKNESGLPDYGTIEQRLSFGLYEFRDAKGKSPIAYTKLMSKLKFTREEVEEEAKRLNYVIDNIHFEYTEEQKRGRPKGEKKVKESVNGITSTGKKGRPKKMNKEVELTSDVGEDIFAALVENANANVLVNNVVSEVSAKVDSSEKSEKDAKKNADKLEKDAKKKVEKEAKKNADKLEKEAKKNADKVEKEAKKNADKVEKDEKKNSEKEAVEKDEKKNSEKEAVEKEEVDVVRKFDYEGTKYLKSKNTGVVYNMDQELVGKWNEITQKIDFEEYDEEEEEDEYDE